jgi:hypothetical protein
MSLSDFSRAMQAFESVNSAQEREVARKFLLDLFIGDCGRFGSARAFHTYATGQHPFL